MKIRLIIPVLALTACSHSEEQPPARAPENSSAKVELQKRFAEATQVLSDVESRVAPEIRGSARCVAVVPGLLSGGFFVGARHGNGFTTCRTAGGWSAPAPISISGASFGAQVGVQSVDLVMLVMNDEGMKKVLSSKFTLGADMSATAGPVGKGKEVDTDAGLKAEVLAYTRSRGLFAGVSVNGAAVEQDVDATEALYGRPATFHELLSGDSPSPEAARQFLAAVGATFKPSAANDVVSER